MASGHPTLEEEERNLFCLTLLLYDLGNHKLRQYFKTQWPIVLHKKTGTMGTEWTDQPADGNKFVVEDAGKIKFKSKAERNKVQSGDTNKWDLSLLTTVIMRSSLKFVANPSSEFDALGKLKTIRNTSIGHKSDSKISTKEFTQNWTDACKALELFGATKDEFTAIEEKLKKPSEELVKLISQLIHQEVELLNISEKIDELDKKEEEHHGEVMGALKVISMGIDKDSPVSSKKICIQMPPEMRLLKQRLDYFKYDVTPDDVLDHLPCLSQEDKEEIICDQNNKGSTLALKTLVDRLTQKRLGFKQFVVALRKSNLDHVALLLDPSYNVQEKDASDDAITDDTKPFKLIGSAVDVRITLRILENNKTRRCDLEGKIATRFELAFSTQSRALRKEFNKHLPKGVHFVYTKQLGGGAITNQTSNLKSTEEEAGKDDVSEDVDMELEHARMGMEIDQSKTHIDSVVTVFRLARAEAVDEFWTFYQDKQLDKLLRRLMVINSTDGAMEPGKSLDLELLFREDDYKEIKCKLQDVVSNKDIEKSEAQPVTIKEGNKKEESVSLEEDEELIIPPVFLDGSSTSDSPLKLREYQKELAAPALEGKNTIICAPTNSGKTFVALEIAKRHLEENKDDAEKGTAEGSRDKVSGPKVFFIVSTQNLVLQQRTFFDKNLGKKYAVSDISGVNATEVPLEFLLETCDVVVLTAQILVNALVNRDVQLSQITLLIFDECHHTQKGHVYNEIMQRYMALKHQPHQEKRLPQVIGLTASLGVGKSKTTEKAEKHILQLCANMDAMCISTVLENTDELEAYVTDHVPTRDIIRVEKTTMNPFEEIINKVMEKIEEDTNIELPGTRPPTTDRLSQQYRQWVEDLDKTASSKALRHIITYAEQLRRYHNSLVINDTIQMKDAMEGLAKYFDNLDESKFIDVDKKLCNWFHKAKTRIEDRVLETGEPVNPKLQWLKEFILQNCKEELDKGNSKPKGILYSQTRESTIGLKRWISETEELNGVLKPETLVGSGDREIGMGQREQESIIQKFKNGAINIIIATTVAEEGLDISDCSYVIRYNMMGNEISSVQSRGRIRAKEGTYIYLADSRSRGFEREKLNQYREIMMIEALANVQCIDPDEYKKKIGTIQHTSMEERGLKERLAASIKSTFLPDDVTFFCKKCNTQACQAHHIKRLRTSYHVVIDNSFKSRINLKIRDKPEEIDGILMDKKIFCRNCGEDWGLTVNIDGREWPCIKIKSFCLQFKGGWRRIFPKWKNAPVTIPEASEEEIIEALKKDSDPNVNFY